MSKTCPKCNKFQVKGDFEFCFTCNAVEKGLKKCPECKWRFYDPNKWQSCYQCGAGSNKTEDKKQEYDVPDSF